MMPIPTTLDDGVLARVTYEGNRGGVAYAYSMIATTNGYAGSFSITPNGEYEVALALFYQTARAVLRTMRGHMTWMPAPTEGAMTLRRWRVNCAHQEPFGGLVARVLDELPHLERASI